MSIMGEGQAQKPVFLFEDNHFRVEGAQLGEGWHIRVRSREGAQFLAERLVVVMMQCGYSDSAARERLAHWQRRITHSRLKHGVWTEVGWAERQTFLEDCVMRLMRKLKIAPTT